MNTRALAGKVAVVTGGMRGIGLATATALTQAGAQVAVGDIDIPTVVSSPSGSGPALCLPLDVSDAEKFAAFLDEVEARLGPLDILVNNAGIMPTGLIEHEDPRATERAVQINLIGVINGTREAIGRMKPRRRGHIINVSSLTARVPGAGVATYSATKAGVLAFCESVAIELLGTGVDITVIQPSLVRTELVSGIAGGNALFSCGPEDVAKRIIDRLRKPRFQAFVPAAIGIAAYGNQMVPARVRHALARLTKADKMIVEMDPAAHASYDERMRRIVLEPGDGCTDAVEQE